MHFCAEAPDPVALAASYDLVVAADGANSATRAAFAGTFRPDLDVRQCKYMWLGTDRVFEAFQFFVEQTPYGAMQVHGYPYAAPGPRSSWRCTRASGAAGFDATDGPRGLPGYLRRARPRRIRELFAGELAGHQLFANNSKWLNFTTVRNERWHHGNLVLVGDAAHTAHFSIGSGTKLAMEDSLALAACLHEHPDVERRSPPTRPSGARWSGRRSARLRRHSSGSRTSACTRQRAGAVRVQPQTRSRRITYDNLRERDADFAAHVNAAFGAAAGAGETPRPPRCSSRSGSAALS